MTDMSNDGKQDRLAVELLRRGRPPNPTTVFLAGVLSDRALFAGRTAGKLLADRLRKGIHELQVLSLTARGLSLPPPLPRLRIRQ
jgi:hypothetical protein